MQNEYAIGSSLGLHLRPAKKIVEAASRYHCAVYLEKDGKRVSAKSLVNVLTIAAKYGDKVILITEGYQEAEAQREIGILLAAALDASGSKEQA